MRFPLLLAAAALLGQADPGHRGLKSFTFPAPAQELKLWLPEGYQADLTVSRRYARIPTIPNPEVVTLRLAYSTTKRPEPPPVPVDADLMLAEPGLGPGSFKFTGSVEPWRGRPISVVRYEGFLQGKIGVYGRMAWLPLEPGTVMVHLYSEPTWAATMNQDWEILLGNIEAPMSALTLRERAPGRWLASTILGGLGSLVALVGIVMILARMNEAIGGSIVYLGLLLPPVPVGYAVLHLPECRRGLGVFLAGAALVGGALVLGR